VNPKDLYVNKKLDVKKTDPEGVASISGYFGDSDQVIWIYNKPDKYSFLVNPKDSNIYRF
jgi:hypothetical protein